MCQLYTNTAVFKTHIAPYSNELSSPHPIPEEALFLSHWSAVIPDGNVEKDLIPSNRSHNHSISLFLLFMNTDLG